MLRHDLDVGGVKDNPVYGTNEEDMIRQKIGD
jgi:hypothetical protein